MAYSVSCSWRLFAVLLVYSNLVKASEPDPECANFSIPGCFCAWLGSILGIYCNNETDLSTLPKQLDSTFNVNDTYEITLQGFDAIPSQVIEGLIVFRLIIDDPQTAHVSETAFDGVIRLRWFHVYLSSITDIPNFKRVPHSLRQVNIDNSLLTKVEVEFQNLPLLTRLSLRNNTIKSVPEDAFSGTTAIEYLDFSHNDLVSLPQNVFRELKGMMKLDLAFNRLHTVDGLFTHLGEKLKFLDLEVNNLTNVDDALHSNLTGLVSLFLNGNPLGKLTVNTFKKTWTKLQFVVLNNCNITKFRVEYFRPIVRLASLALAENQINDFGNQSMDFGKTWDLVLNSNGIESFAGGITPKTKRLFITNNKIRHLGTMLQHTQMAEVDVSRNRLVAIENEDFHGSHSTENLAFRDNEIERIDSDCFTAFQNSLYTLDLSNNRLTSLNLSMRYLSQLKALNVSFNYLETLGENEFVGLNTLSELYMQNNRIMVLKGQIQTIPHLQYLILQNNTMTSLDIKQIPNSLKYFYIKGNPIKCNCKLYLSFLSKLTKDTVLDKMPCTNASKDLYQPCPSPCGCHCKRDANSSFVNVDCSSRYLTQVPSILSNWSIFASPPDGVYRIDDLRFTIYDHALSLNLSNNSISSLKDVQFSKNLKELFLADNRLTTLPYSLINLTKLREVTISENPWACDCDDGKALKVREWMLSKNSYILDVNQTRCYSSNEDKDLVGKLIVDASEADLCPNEIGMYITLTFSVLCLLLLAAAMKITYTRYELNIKVWLYSKGITWVKEKDIDRDKRFDAFLSFSHCDHDFVTEHIIEEIEQRCPNINLCIHYRHFIAGRFIHENIMDAVENSKRTVLILTKNFLDSEWCMMEFRAADVQNIKDKVRRVIVIKIGDLPSEIDPSIKVYMDSTTYLTWGEKYFWEKLLYALPRTSTCQRQSQSTTTLLS